MAESLHERIAAAIVARLGAIRSDGGTAYWYTPDRVVRWHALTQQVLDDSLRFVYCLSPDEIEEEEEATGGIIAHARMDLALCARFQTPHETPFAGDEEPSRQLVQHRMLQDVEKALRSDVTFGGLSHNLNITRVELSAEVTYVLNWVLVMLRLEVPYSYRAVTP